MTLKNSFVLMPFSESQSEVYDHLIKGSLEEAGYLFKRADDIKNHNNILEDIIRSIALSDLIIADLSDSNPNIYYQLGIAHALNKKVILITQDINELPFDLRSCRVITYDTHFAKMQNAKEELVEMAKEAIKDKVPFRNPVKDFSLNVLTNKKSGEHFSNPETIEERGVLECQFDVEDSFAALTEIIEQVGGKLSDELTPKILSTAEKIHSQSTTTKQRKTFVQELANHMEEYGKFLIPNNEEYKVYLKKIETSLEFLLSGDMDYENEEAIKDIVIFIDSLKSMEEGAFIRRKGFCRMLEVQKQMPKFEQAFNRSNKFMQEQIEQFIENIDLTISLSSIARILGNTTLKKHQHE